MKSLSAALAALSLAFAAGTAAAAPVSLSFSNNNIMSAGDLPATFDDAYGFGLDAQTLLSGVVTTHSPEVNGPWVNITSAFIQASGGGPVYALTETVGVNWDADQFGVETWTFAPQWLDAGDWTLHVVGEGYGTKQPEGYTADLSGNSVDLPEPAALALVAIALAGMGLSSRRRVR